MRLTTQIPIAKESPSIGYDSKVVSLGSCFAVNMAQKLAHFQFQQAANPFGILFHPQAIERLIGYAVSGRQFTEPDVFFHNERWHHFDAHSDLSHPGRQQLLDTLNRAAPATLGALKNASHLIITYGTAWVYRERESGRTVANCHKVPQKAFEKRLLSVAEITESVENTLAMLRAVNPELTVIFTVSPVRHLKDGFANNQRSKAHLISALHEVLETDARYRYFPAYEIMMDELRDYRFYADDMIHPSGLAIDYIWQRFADAWITADVLPVMERVDSIRKRLAHRAFNAESESHRQFTEKLAADMDSLRQTFPHMVFG